MRCQTNNGMVIYFVTDRYAKSAFDYTIDRRHVVISVGDPHSKAAIIVVGTSNKNAAKNALRRLLLAPVYSPATDKWIT